MACHNFKEGEYVVKEGGDYTFAGIVVSAFTKKNGVIRYVVEDDRGLLFIFNEMALRLGAWPDLGYPSKGQDPSQ